MGFNPQAAGPYYPCVRFRSTWFVAVAQSTAVSIVALPVASNHNSLNNASIVERRKEIIMFLFGTPNISDLKKKKDIKKLIQIAKNNRNFHLQYDAAIALFSFLNSKNLIADSEKSMIINAIKRPDEFKVQEKILYNVNNRYCWRCGGTFSSSKVYASHDSRMLGNVDYVNYGADICTKCGRIECGKCKPGTMGPHNTPRGWEGDSCSWCGGLIRTMHDSEFEIVGIITRNMTECFL
jgi:hypothetical protein